ncbi:hypothetical protein [Streptosporangium sp. NPDC049644]|uniref:hypothetical protein n=1 Tax=Streptosporangium sp. NPDC049644 TaxID=3155507 RepID=UPI00341D6DBE
MIAKPPGWPLLTAFSLTALVCLWWASAPYLYVELLLFAFFAGGVLFLVWITRIIVAAITDSNAVSAHIRQWFVPWMILGGVVLSIIVDAPFYARFALSQPALTAFAETVAKSGQVSHECRYVGLYRVCWSESTPGGGARFSVDDWLIRTSAGFVWSPAGQMPGDDVENLDPLVGPWYRWSGWDEW